MKRHQGDFPFISGSFTKMYSIYRKIHNSDEGDFAIIFGKKRYILEEILGLISGSLPEDHGGFTCMKFKLFKKACHLLAFILVQSNF